MGSVSKRLDVVAARKYNTRSGEEKTHWINVGEAAEWDDGGVTIRLHALPCGQWWDCTLKLFERKEREQQSTPRRAPAKQATADGDFNDDDIPF